MFQSESTEWDILFSFQGREGHWEGEGFDGGQEVEDGQFRWTTME